MDDWQSFIATYRQMTASQRNDALNSLTEEQKSYLLSHVMQGGNEAIELPAPQAGIRKYVKVRTTLLFMGFYIFLLVITFKVWYLGVFFVIYSALSAFATFHFVEKEKNLLLRSQASEFKKNFPLRLFGLSYLDFKHVFPGIPEKNIAEELAERFSEELVARSLLPRLAPAQLTDIDRDLVQRETRRFLISSSKPTLWESTVTLAILPSSRGQMQGVDWWILVSGFIDPNKVFSFIAFSPISIPFWLFPYLRREHDLIANIRTVYPAFYNSFDIIGQVRCIHRLLYDCLVDVLEKNGVDTSDLKQGRSQNLNVSISGGKATFGSIIQGAFNKVTPGKEKVASGQTA